VIGGKSELTEVFSEGWTVVYGVKTGQESDPHIVQVMYLLSL